jgi:FdhD protein
MISKIKIRKFIDDHINAAEDIVAIEEPLEISLSFIENSRRIEKIISVTMRTPGNDEFLSLGFLFTEGIIDNYNEVKDILMPAQNKICIVLNENISVNLNKLERNFYTTSSCGVCGKSSIDAIITSSGKKINKSDVRFDSKMICNLPSQLRNQQEIFEQTGGLHASALFDADYKLHILHEDVGRHNALDKLIGEAFRKNSIPLNNYILLLSGRASFELIQKAFMANINTIAAIGAPSSLAVELANEKNITLIGFLKKDKFNIYSGGENID